MTERRFYMQYKINKGFITQKLDNKTVIFDGEESVLYTFNETASLVFQKLKQGLKDKQIIEAVVKKYKVKEKQVKKDYTDLIADLKKKKILSVEKSRK
jgi:hypothetical protein